MTKDEELAMDLALEALEYIHEGANNQGPHTGISWRCVSVKAEPAIKAIKQARALDKMAENARELGLDYEPAEVLGHNGWGFPIKAAAPVQKECDCAAHSAADCVCGAWDKSAVAPVQEDWGPGPHECHSLTAASVQEPVAWRYRGILHEFDPSDWAEGPVTPLYTTPPAAPTSAEYAMGYAEGFNDGCKPEPVQEPVAFFDPQGKGFYWAKPTKITAPVTVDVEPLPLYTTPPAQPAPVQERNFCERCGKRLGSGIHTCTPPAAPVQEPDEWLTGCPECGMDSGCDCDSGTWNPPAAPVQVSPLEFVTMVMEKEHLVGKPLFWAEWPNKEKNT